ncbi:uncharacterized protein LOC118420167 [Branchiostoma floridae]|uniref:Uncharacterized protein LOC118420167 n=1 Tax=Branchiostoma floridae TaxID=7739 RepID=A0A9J7MVE0_BRAFL|nr:uncharacterized protein LOC118420167 [Branchiostoma floridae]
MRPLLAIVLQILLNGGIFLGVGSSASRCPHQDPPINGALSCDTWLYGQFCSVQCDERYDFLTEPARMYICGSSGQWRTDPPGKETKWSDFTVRRNAEFSKGIEFQYYEGDCPDEESRQNQVKQNFVNYFNITVFGRFGGCIGNINCTADNVRVDCGEKNDDIVVDLVPEEASTTPMTTTTTAKAMAVSMVTSSNSDGASADQAGNMSGATIGGAVAAGVVILIIAVVVFIAYVKRRRPSDSHIYDEPPASQFELAEAPNDIQVCNGASKYFVGALLSDDGEYVDTLPSMVTLEQPDAQVDCSISLRQSRNSCDYETISQASSSGDYQELQPAVYQSLQKF